MCPDSLDGWEEKIFSLAAMEFVSEVTEVAPSPPPPDGGGGNLDESRVRRAEAPAKARNGLRTTRGHSRTESVWFHRQPSCGLKGRTEAWPMLFPASRPCGSLPEADDGRFLITGFSRPSNLSWELTR